MVRAIPVTVPTLVPDSQKAQIISSIRVTPDHPPKAEVPALVRKVKWTVTDVSKPKDWYEQTQPSLNEPSDSTTDIQGHAENVEHSEEKDESETYDASVAKTPRTKKKKKKAVLHEDDDLGARTVLNPLTEAEILQLSTQKRDQVNVQLVERGREIKSSEEREAYLNQMKNWMEEQIHQFHRQTDGCDEFISSRLERQQEVDDVAKLEADRIMQDIISVRKEKLSKFARTCQDWHRLVSEKNDLVHRKLAEYRAWKPWDVTEFYMKNHVHKLATDAATEKKHQYRELTKLRVQHGRQKDRWRVEHQRRMDLVAKALEKEYTTRVERHLNTKRAPVQELLVRHESLQKEIKTWEEIKGRWAELLQNRITDRRSLVYDLDRVRLPDCVPDFDAPVVGEYKASFFTQRRNVEATLNELYNDIDQSIQKYRIPVVDVEAAVEPEKEVVVEVDYQDEEEPKALLPRFTLGLTVTEDQEDQETDVGRRSHVVSL